MILNKMDEHQKEWYVKCEKRLTMKLPSHFFISRDSRTGIVCKTSCSLYDFESGKCGDGEMCGVVDERYRNVNSSKLERG